jgi:TolB-like protein/DNA-binding SARP family transcriptional activator
MITLRLFGGISLESAEGPVSGRATQRRRLALLALLAAAPTGAVSRDRIIALLWPDSETAEARHLLSVALYELRRTLGEDAIVTLGDDVRLNSAMVETDVGEFRRALEGSELERAVSLYAGPFLDGVFVSGASEFERWTEAERERLARAFASALESLADQRTVSGDLRGAVDLWRRRAALDPTDSRVARRLITLLAAAGDRAGALQQARLHETLLREEYGMEADPELRQAVEELKRAPVEVPKEQRAALVVAATPEGAPTTQPGNETLVPVSRRRRHLVLALGFAAIAAGTSLLWPSSTGDRSTIAVLPFVNRSGDPANEYFTDGVTEELITSLGSVDGLRVVARTSAFAFRGRNVDVREIGDRLGAALVLEGSVRQSGERVRIDARLVRASDGYQLWSDTFDGQLGDVFALQEQLAARIVSELRMELRRDPGDAERRDTRDAEARTLYLKGRYVMYGRGREGLEQAAAYFRGALDRDSSYARAWAGLADSYARLGSMGYRPHAEVFPQARAAASRALALDDGLAEAHTALAYALVAERDVRGGEEHFRRAIQLAPSHADAHHWYGFVLAVTGRFEDGLRELHLARELDPLSIPIGSALGRALIYAGEYDRAIAQYEELLELQPELPALHFGIGFARLEQGEHTAAIAAARRALELEPESRPALALLACAHARAGERDSALAIARRLERNASGLSLFYLGAVHSVLGNRDEAFRWLERAAREEPSWLISMDVEPWFDPLRADPRFATLQSQIAR